MRFTTVVQRHRDEIAFVVGNGINRFGKSSGNSWRALLLELWNRHSTIDRKGIPPDIALTEFFDLVAIGQGRRAAEKSLQREFCELLEEWSPQRHHRQFVAWAQNHGSPVLTTNFENNLGDAGGCSLRHIAGEKFTDFYPWRSYYSTGKVVAPASEFAIWHVNGMERYHRSIRLGLTDYMGSVARARGWIHRGGSSGLLGGQNVESWKGARSWLQVVFSTPLAIFGLGLEQNEVFLRWLLIERARFFQRYPDRRREAWYVFREGRLGLGKRLFLESVGVRPIAVADYAEIYREPWM